MLSITDPNRFRRSATAAALVVGPAALAVSSAVKVVSSSDAREMLIAVAAHPGRETASDAAQLAAVLLLVPATIGLVRFFGGRGSTLGHLAIGLVVLNGIGNAADVVHGALLSTLARDGVSATDVALVTRLDDSGLGSVVQLLTLVGLLGFPLLAAALWRSRTAPRWVPVVLVAGVVSFFFPINEGVGATLMWVAFGALGLQLARPGRRGATEPGLAAA
jgi:hypothetical protein